MQSKEKARKLMGRKGQRDALKMWSKLQVRMTISYVAVSVAIALLLELLLIGLFFIVVLPMPFVDKNTQDVANRTAQDYALEAAVQAGGASLDPRSTFQPGQPSSLALQDADPSTSQIVNFVLLITPNGQVLASSDPAHYPISTPVARLLPKQTQLIINALAGSTRSVVDVTAQGHIVSIAQPVWSKQQKPIGAIYLQTLPQLTFGGGNVLPFATFLFFTAIFWIILTTPIGAFFGVVTTRNLVRRLHRLVGATAQFAKGDYTQRVPITRKDEIGQLESQFNQMAEQLVASIAQQQTLIEHQARLEERARIEQELRTAQYIQRALLPKDVPTLPYWQLAPFYRPAREVGGDFYDFLPFADGQMGIVIGDVTGKGVSAALVMATTCTMLRAAAQGDSSPSEVLARVNDLLSANIPSGMFATCFYAILDPSNGRLRYANAGQDWPYRWHSGGVSALQASGMPLGMMPGMRYEEQEEMLGAGESLLFYSDGVVEAHNTQREMFGLPRLEALIRKHSGGNALIDVVLDELAAFTGADWEQEDDVTLVTLQRAEDIEVNKVAPQSAMQGYYMDGNNNWQTLDEWTVPSQPGNERMAMERAAEAVKALHLPTKRLEQIKTAVAEATMNAMEHGNHYQADEPVAIQMRASQTALAIRIRDQGGSKPIPEASEPDLDAKLAELQTPRGWGLFLIKNMVDEMHVTSDETHHTIELIVYL